MLHFVTSCLKQNKVVNKLSRLSARDGLEISFNMPIKKIWLLKLNCYFSIKYVGGTYDAEFKKGLGKIGAI